MAEVTDNPTKLGGKCKSGSVRSRREAKRLRTALIRSSPNPYSSSPFFFPTIVPPLIDTNLLLLSSLLVSEVFSCRKCCNFEPKRSHVQSFFIANLSQSLSRPVQDLSGCYESQSCGAVADPIQSDPSPCPAGC